MQDLLQELRKMVSEEEKNPSFSQGPNFSPSPLKSRKKRLSRRSRGNVTPETGISKSQIGSEIKVIQEKIMESAKILIEGENSKLKNEMREFMIEVMKQMKKMKAGNGGQKNFEDFDELFEEIDHLKSDNNQLVQHMKNFNNRVEKMEMRLFNYEMELGTIKNNYEESNPKITDMLIKEKNRELCIQNLTKECSEFSSRLVVLENQIKNIGTDLDLVSNKEVQDVKKLGEFVIQSQKEILEKLGGRIDELTFSSKFKDNSSHPSQRFDENSVLEVLENESNRERVQSILRNVAAEEETLDNRLNEFARRVEKVSEEIRKELNEGIKGKAEELKTFVNVEIERVSQVVDQLGEEIEEGQGPNYCSLSKFVMRDELEEVSNKIDDYIGKEKERFGHQLDDKDTSTVGDSIGLKVDELESDVAMIKKKVEILVDSKLDKNEADLFQSEFERIVRRLEELSTKIETSNKGNQNLENSAYITKEYHRSPKRRATSGLSYQLSPDEGHSHDFTEDKIRDRMVDFTKQRDPVAVSVQSEQDRGRSSKIHSENGANSSRKNNFNSLEKTLKFNIEASKSKKSSKESSQVKRVSKLGVEELKLSYVYSNNKDDIGFEDLDTPQDIEGIVSRRLFEKKDIPSDSSRGLENKSQNFLGALQEISKMSKKKFSSEFSSENDKLNSESFNSLADKENICKNSDEKASSILFTKNIAKQKEACFTEEINPKVIEPENQFDFDQWAKENSLNLG